MREEFYITDLHKGNEESFRAIYKIYRTRLCYFASKLLPDGESPEDVVQEAFVKLWQKHSHFHHPDSVKAFLYITVKNRCLNLSKHGKVVDRYNHLLHEEANEEIIADYLLESEVLDNIYRALEKLPQGCRKVLQLSYFQELKNKEIAERLQVSVNTVKTQKKRGLHLLRGLLKVTSIWSFMLLLHLF